MSTPKSFVLLTLSTLIACGGQPESMTYAPDSIAETTTSSATDTGSFDTGSFDTGETASDVAALGEQVIAEMDPFVTVTAEGRILFDREGLIEALRAESRIADADAVAGIGEATAYSEQMDVMVAGFPLGERVLMEVAQLPPGTYVNWKWYGVDFWFDGSTANTVVVSLKAASAASIATIAGLVSYASAGAASIIALGTGAAVGSLSDSYISWCGSDGWIGIRVHWWATWRMLC
jgi:hypothetical protein